MASKPKEDHDAQDETHPRRDRFQAAPSRCSGLIGRGGSVALNSRFRRDKWSPAGFRLLRIAAAGGSRPGPASAGQGWSGVSVHCTTRVENAHGTGVREVLYRWHPWFGLAVHVHAAATKADGVYFRCTLNGADGIRWQELPAWMFDRAACAGSCMLVAEPLVS